MYFCNMGLYGYIQMAARFKDLLRSINKRLDQLEDLLQYAPPDVKEERTKRLYPALKESIAELEELSRGRRKKDNLDRMLELFDHIQEIQRISNQLSKITTKLKKHRQKDLQGKKLIECINKIDKEILQV